MVKVIKVIPETCGYHLDYRGLITIEMNNSIRFEARLFQDFKKFWLAYPLKGLSKDLKTGMPKYNLSENQKEKILNRAVLLYKAEIENKLSERRF
jgi:hypothetical protein